MKNWSKKIVMLLVVAVLGFIAYLNMSTIMASFLSPVEQPVVVQISAVEQEDYEGYWERLDRLEAEDETRRVEKLKQDNELFLDQMEARKLTESDTIISLNDKITSLLGKVEQLNALVDKWEGKKSEPKPVTLVDTIQQVKPGVVHIMCPQWQGSGFVVGPNLIITARHCVEGVEDFTITTDEGHKLHATRARSHGNYDTAFIYVDDLTCVAEKALEIECKKIRHKVKLNVLELGSIKDCQLGQQIFVVGSPYGKINFNSVSLGIISGVGRSWEELGGDYGWSVAFTVDSAGHPGNSGGPVFSMDGKVRGILVGGFSPVLISVMPCDLFIEDIELIVDMFRQDKYRKEVKTDQAAEAWGY